MSVARAPADARWALSFADLCLLLLGFMLMLQAQRANPAAVAAGLRGAFGKAQASVADRRAAAMFEPGEAILNAAARADLARIGAAAAVAHAAVTIESRGRDAGGRRFDGWELAAARTAAVSRAVAAGGLDPSRVDLSIAPASAAAGAGQMLRITMAGG